MVEDLGKGCDTLRSPEGEGSGNASSVGGTRDASRVYSLLEKKGHLRSMVKEMLPARAQRPFKIHQPSHRWKESQNKQMIWVVCEGPGTTFKSFPLARSSYVTELTKKIHTKSSGHSQEDTNSAEFVRFFPAFIWAVRDFTLQLEIDGRPITEDEYLENALKLQEGEMVHRACVSS